MCTVVGESAGEAAVKPVKMKVAEGERELQRQRGKRQITGKPSALRIQRISSTPKL